MTQVSDITAEEHNPDVFIHTADLHLAPRNSSMMKRDAETGRLLRDLDMDAAFINAVDATLAETPLPSAFVIAGDIFDTYAGSPDAFITVVREFRRLIDHKIHVIAIAGNHDTPTNNLKTSMFTMLSSIPFDSSYIHLAYDEIKHIIVGNIEYVLLPHQVCLKGGFTAEDLKPSGNVPYSVLVVHGVAAGDPSLQQMDEAKEIPIAKWILDMPWTYIAFGHYHKPGWIPGYKYKAAYSGSLENTVISGPDVCMHRGPNYIDLSHAGTEDVRDIIEEPIRPIVNLKDIDLHAYDHELSASEVDDAIADAITNNKVKHAIVLLRVKNITRTTYKALPRRNWQSCDPSALFIRVVFEYAETMHTDVSTEEGTDSENDDAESQENTASDTLLPLNVEAENAVDSLVSSGTIPAKFRDKILAQIRTLIANENL